MAWRNGGIEADALRGRGLRFVLVDQIRRRRTCTVAELVKYIANAGYELPGRPSKIISDALRWEVARGRVVRTARGRYSYGHVPSTTARRIRVFAERCLAWIVAVTRSEIPPPTPPTRQDRRIYPWLAPENPDRPPWHDYGWLWTTG